ncbi:MAG TPA: AAA family ATPase, partial [Polyangiales bacterium]|nr:AAA family ATPase [Polyangiales bacterium]
MKTFDERRVATVLFVDMCGYSAFIGDEDPEDVARVLEQLKETASNVIEACGGVVNQFVGDEIVALFGVRQSHEDDARRAVTAALLLHERARGIALSGTRPVLLHTGIETGLVLARARDFRSGVYDVIGEPVNLAARLRSQAGPDEILLGPRTILQVGPFFDVEPVESFVPRGMTQVVQPARVLKPSSAQNTFDTALRRGLTDYVGRDAELARMMALAHSVEQGHGACLAVAGAPGMGKTRLFYEARKRVRSVLARIPAQLVGRCTALAEAPAYHPFVDALQKLIEELGDDQDVNALLGYGEELAPHLPVFAYLLGRENSTLALSGERLREAIVEALATLLGALARERLALVILEDWHWADEASSAALRQLVVRLAPQRVLFAVNYRTAELPTESLVSTLSLELAPLDRTQTAEMAALALEAAYVPDELISHIHDTTQGNPFFIEETCRSLIETGAIAQRGAGVLLTCPVAQLTTPNSVQAMVRARIDRLRAADKELLRLASVLGSEFSEDLLLILARASDRLSDYVQGEPAELIARLERQLAQLELSGLIYRAHKGDSARFRFKHAITREVAYADLPRDDRRAHHERIGCAIEQRRPLAPWYDQLAHHFGASPSLDKAVLYAERAADHAMRAFSLQRAMRHYRSAIEGLDQSELTREQQRRRVQLSLKWAACCVFNPAREQLAVLEQSLHWTRASDDPRAAVRCLCWMAWLAHVVGDQQRAVGLYQDALDEAQKLRDDLFSAQIRGNLGYSYAMAARHDEAQAALQQDLGTRQRVSALVGGGYGYTLAYQGMIAGDQGEFERARQLFERALATVNETGRMTLVGAVLTM